MNFTEGRIKILGKGWLEPHVPFSNCLYPKKIQQMFSIYPSKLSVLFSKN